MLQIDHVYEFFSNYIFNDIDIYYLPGGVPENKDNVVLGDFHIVCNNLRATNKIFFFEQEPLSPLLNNYMPVFDFPNATHSVDFLEDALKNRKPPYTNTADIIVNQVLYLYNNTDADEFASMLYKKKTLATSEISSDVDAICKQYDCKQLYYFFHGFAALDWYRGFRLLNHSKRLQNNVFDYDFVSFNRITGGNRAYRIYWVALLAEKGLLGKGQVSFAVDGVSWAEELKSPDTKLSVEAKECIHKNLDTLDAPLVIDDSMVPGWASADIPRVTHKSMWHIVSETVYYYNKLHLTEKIFKPIVMKQPFMLLAAPGNLAYLKRYGFKTFSNVIDEGYDDIADPDERMRAVATQLEWYCNLSSNEKTDVIAKLDSIVEYNFTWFYTGFKDLIIDELITNCKKVATADVDWEIIKDLLN